MKTIFSSDTEFIELNDKIKLSKSNSKNIGIDYSIMSFYNNWYLYQNQYYYFKKCNNIYILRHLLGEKIADYFRVPTVHFIPAKVGKTEGLSTLNFRKKEYSYLPFYDLYGMSTKAILKLYENNFMENKNELHNISPLLRLIAFHIYTDLTDLNDCNLLVQKSKKGLAISPTFDYDLMFLSDLNFDNYFYNSAICSLELPSKDFENIITDYPEFKEYLHYFVKIDTEKIIEQVREEYHLQNFERFLEDYKKNDEIKKEFIRKLHL